MAPHTGTDNPRAARPLSKISQILGPYTPSPSASPRRQASPTPPARLSNEFSPSNVSVSPPPKSSFNRSLVTSLLTPASKAQPRPSKDKGVAFLIDGRTQKVAPQKVAQQAAPQKVAPQKAALQQAAPQKVAQKAVSQKALQQAAQQAAPRNDAQSTAVKLNAESGLKKLLQTATSTKSAGQTQQKQGLSALLGNLGKREASSSNTSSTPLVAGRGGRGRGSGEVSSPSVSRGSGSSLQNVLKIGTGRSTPRDVPVSSPGRGRGTSRGRDRSAPPTPLKGLPPTPLSGRGAPLTPLAWGAPPTPLGGRGAPPTPLSARGAPPTPLGGKGEPPPTPLSARGALGRGSASDGSRAPPTPLGKAYPVLGGVGAAKGVLSSALATPHTKPEVIDYDDVPETPITLGHSTRNNALSLLNASLVKLRRRTMAEEELAEDLPWVPPGQQQRGFKKQLSERQKELIETNKSNISPRRNSVAAQLLTSIREDSKIPLEARRSSLSSEGPMADLMRNLSRGKLKSDGSVQDVSIPRRRFTAYDLVAGTNDSPGTDEGPRRDAVALGIPNEVSLALASTSVTELLKPSETQPAIVEEQPTPVLNTSYKESPAQENLQAFRFGDASSEAEEDAAGSPLVLPKQEPRVPSSPETPGGFSPRPRSQSAKVPRSTEIHLPSQRSVSMLDFTSPRALELDVQSAGERLMKLRAATVVSPVGTGPTLAAIPRHAASYIRHLKYDLSVDDEALCWVVLCGALACTETSMSDFGRRVDSVYGSEHDSKEKPVEGQAHLEMLLANTEWAEEVARPLVEDLEQEAVDNLLKEFGYGKDAVAQHDAASPMSPTSASLHSPDVMSPRAPCSPAPRVGVSMADAATGMTRDVAVEAMPASDADEVEECGGRSGTSQPKIKNKKRKKKKKKLGSRELTALDKRSAMSSPIQGWDTDHTVDAALLGTIKSLEDKVNKVLEQTSPGPRKHSHPAQLPPMILNRGINLDLQPTEAPPEEGPEPVEEVAINSKELWNGFLAKGKHPKDKPPNKFIDYCCSLGYSKFEALCIAALWYNQEEGKPEASVIDDEEHGTGMHTYPVGNGASYTDLLPGSPLFKAVANEVMETCHAVSFMKGEQFKVVRVVEAHCNEEVTSDFMQAKGDSRVKILYYNPLKMKPFLNTLIEGISTDFVFSSEAIIRRRPMKGQSLCLLLCEAAIGRCKAVTLKDPSNRSELQRVLKTSNTDAVSSTYSVRCMDGSIKVGRHYASQLGALPRFMVQVEVKDVAPVAKDIFKRSAESSEQMPEMKRELVVECPDVEELQGVYEKVGTLRDMPIFAKDSCRLFTDSRNGWMFSDTADGPDKDEGIVTSVNAHTGKLPHSMKKWQCSNGAEWVKTQVTITERIVDRFDSLNRCLPPPLPTVGKKKKGVHSYTTPVTGYGLWEWVFRISSCTGQVGFGIGVGDCIYVDVPAPADVTIRLGLRQQEAELTVYKVNKAKSCGTKVILLWSPTQLVFPQVDFPVEGKVRMLAPPRHVSTLDE